MHTFVWSPLCSVWFYGVWGLAFTQNSGRSLFRDARLDPQPVFLLLKRMDQVSQRESHHYHRSTLSVLYLTPLCPHHITTGAEQEGESPSSSLNTLLHSKRDKRKGGLLYQILIEASGRCNSFTNPVGNFFFPT